VSIRRHEQHLALKAMRIVNVRRGCVLRADRPAIHCSFHQILSIRLSWQPTAETDRAYGSLTKEELEQKRVEVTMAGRIIAMRSFGKACFSHIQDSSGKTQVFSRKNTLGEDRTRCSRDRYRRFHRVKGFVFRTKNE